MVEAALEAQPEWTYTDENLALLVDRLDYWLTSEYGSWVTDPNDPEVKRKRQERKQAGVKPPPIPIITPVAKRPPEQDQRAREEAKFLQTLFEKGNSPTESKLDALDKLLG